MTPSEIIRKDSEKRGIDVDTVLQGVNALIQGNAAILLQENNSIALLHNLGDNRVDVHFFTVDSPVTMASSIARIFTKIQDSEIEKVYGKADNEQIIRLMRSVGVNTQDSDLPEYNWMWVAG